MFFHKEKRDEQSANPAVAVQKRVYRFELIVNECDLDQGIKTVIRIHVFFQVGHGLVHIIYGEGNISGIGEGASLTTDPVLGMKGADFFSLISI